MLATTVFLFLLAAYECRAQSTFVPPAPLIEPLHPIGIRMSIPNQRGITLVAYHVKFNDEMVGLEAGTIARDIVKAKNGRWTYHDKTTQLYKGDVLYYWIHVVYRGLGYNLVDQEYVVHDFYDYSGNKIPSTDEGSDVSYNNTNNDTNNINNGNGGINNSSGWNQNNGSINDDLNAGQGNTCKLSQTKQADNSGRTWNPCAGQVIFYDDFQNLQTFVKKPWAHVEHFPDSPDYEFNLYRYSLVNININKGLKITPKLLRDDYGERFVEDGKLTLKQCTGKVGTVECTQQARGFTILPPVTSSRVNTKNIVNFEYGRVEIRAKLPSGDWIYPLLMLEPMKRDDRSVASLRIRIASANGNPELSTFDGRDIGGNILWGGVTGLNWTDDQIDIRDNGYVATYYNSKAWADEYHTYEIVWTKDNIVLKVDGQSYYDKQASLPSIPFYLTLGVAVGGLNEFPDWSMSRGYAKPWRNVEAKALYRFFNSTSAWYNTWRANATSLDVEYVRITAL